MELKLKKSIPIFKIKKDILKKKTEELVFIH